MEFTNEVYDAINRYFSLLKHTGYKPYKQVDNLLVMVFIEELLEGPLSQYITEKDYNSIVNSLYCLYGTCMIPFPDYKKAIDEVLAKSPDKYRATEDGAFRVSETIGLRIMS
jgi:hypothetical protein